MSKEPIFIKCNLFITYEDMMETKKKILKQFEEDNPVIVLPYGFELAEVNDKMLEEIKAEVKTIRDMEVVNGGVYVREFDVVEIIDNHISELKGENK